MKLKVPIFNFSVKNAANDAIDIFIDGDIVDASTQSDYEQFFGDETTTSYKSFRDQILQADVSTFNVYINSGGGNVIEAMAIHDLLQDLQNKGKTVNTIGRGIIASSATYILMAGRNPVMSKNSWLMIHNVSMFLFGQFDVTQTEQIAASLRKFNNASRDFYSTFTGIRKEDITRMMDAETWLTADDAQQKGFIKTIEGEAQFTQKIPKDHWQFSNKAVLNAYNASVKPPQQNSQTQNFDEMKKFFQDLGDKIMNAISGIKAPENNDHSALMQSIGQVISEQFKNASDGLEAEIEKTVETKVDEAVKEATKPADPVEPTEEEKKAAEDAKKAQEDAEAAEKKEKDELKETVQNLKKQVEEMETDLKNSLGKKSKAENNAGEGKKQIGTFHKD